MIMLQKYRRLAWLMGLAAIVIGVHGCGSDKGVGNQSSRGSVYLLMHDAPVDSLRAVWLTVDSVHFMGGSAPTLGASGESALSSSVRMNFMSLDSISRIVAIADVAAGACTKIRLHVSNPEFVLGDGSVVDSSAIKLAADGHVDLNPQGQLIIARDSTSVIRLDLDLKNSIQVNHTGNGRFILNPQIKIDAGGAGELRVTIEGTVTSVNSTSGQIRIQGTGSQVSTVIQTSAETRILAIGGLTVSLGTVSAGSLAEIQGTLNQRTGIVTASQVQLIL